MVVYPPVNAVGVAISPCGAAKPPQKSNHTSLVLGDQKSSISGLPLTLLALKFWFYCFLEGAPHGMEQDWRPNKAIPIELLLILLESTELKILQEAITPRANNRWLVFYAYVVVYYTLSL
jgi:hypothetical protein